MRFSVVVQDKNGVKKIPFWTIDEQFEIRVRKRRKLRLNELYPQRAIIEEDRRIRKNVNDFIDHEYYETKVHESFDRQEKLRKNFNRYGVWIRK